MKLKRFGIERLRSLIEADRDTTGVVSSRDGKISRSHYARIIGCTPSALFHYIDILYEYEKELEIASGPMRFLPKMREWLTNAYARKQLEFSRGILRRTEFALHFSLKGGTYLIRYPEIRTLLEEFDERARRESYLVGPAEFI